ncbi:MAG: transcriptional regulator FtsR [Pseudonocardiaceae bacterium]
MTAAAGRSSSPGPGASIGSVLAQLRADFPDVTISKIRFLESEGLVQPQRTAAGYRQFSLADVARLRYVLAAQRDHYLPLKVIKEHLAAMDRGEHGVPADGSTPRLPRPLVGLAGSGGATGPAEPEDFGATDTARMTREELLAVTGIDAAVLIELEQFGLIRPGPAGFYDPDAVLVARTVRAMTDFGLEPRHLRAFRASADREVGLLAQIVTPMTRQRDPDARARADEVVRELAALSVRLHALLVKTGLRGAIGN